MVCFRINEHRSNSIMNRALGGGEDKGQKVRKNHRADGVLARIPKGNMNGLLKDRRHRGKKVAKRKDRRKKSGLKPSRFLRIHEEGAAKHQSGPVWKASREKGIVPKGLF